MKDYTPRYKHVLAYAESRHHLISLQGYASEEQRKEAFDKYTQKGTLLVIKGVQQFTIKPEFVAVYDFVEGAQVPEKRGW